MIVLGHSDIRQSFGDRRFIKGDMQKIPYRDSDTEMCQALSIVPLVGVPLARDRALNVVY